MNSPDHVSQLEHWLEDLTRKWERFFARDPKVPVPPDRERSALERRLREVSRGDPRTTAESFRMEQLLQRFMVYNQLWQRQLRDREEARTAAGEAARAAAGGNAPAPASVTVEEGGYQALHRRYLEALQASGSKASVNFDRFRETLEKQRMLFEERGVRVEGFDVVQEGTQVKVKARVRREKG